MTDLVVWNGAQWPVDRLPAGVDVADTVPLDKWLANERTTAKKTKPVAVEQPARKTKSKRAKKTGEG